MLINRFYMLLLLFVSQYVFAGSQILVIENPPPPIDLTLVNRLWEYAKKEMGAPNNIAPPKITLDWNVPKYARMGTQFPTIEIPDMPIQISIAPRTIDSEDRLIVIWGLGHEITHYLFALQENGWDLTLKVFSIKRRHHCDPEFKRITRGMAQELWNVYHSDDIRGKMFEEVIRSCANFPQQ